jgi:coenzyme F420-0:L-glutamate ligase / coenzyme F420-1:gamma-L-glutamate ligase
MPAIELIGLEGLPEFNRGDEPGDLIARAASDAGIRFRPGDILVVAQKVISKAEGRLVNLKSVTPSAMACEIAERQHRDPRLVELILAESSRIVRMDDRVLITETRHGYVCANSGIDHSNIPDSETVALLPIDPNRSAQQLRSRLAELVGSSPAIIITDTFGRAWREGLVNVAIGVAGLEPLVDYRGQADDHGHVLTATVLALADEVAAASGLIMRKSARLPAVIARGVAYTDAEGSAKDLIRPKERDLFR